MSDPLVSVIMSVRNSESTLRDALESIFAQTYENWECIICDDASDDGTPDLLRRIVAERPELPIITMKNATNRRLAYSLNRCLEVAKGQLVARMDADDFSEPDRLERQVRFLQAHPDVHLVGTAMRRFNEDGPGEVLLPPEAAPDRGSLGRSGKSPFFHATILMRREAFNIVGGYTVSWRTERGQDLDLWFKFFAAELIGRNMMDPLYRVREDAAAIRRRTMKTRIGAYVTRLKGSWALGYPLSAYLRATANMLKILIPYKVFDLHRAWTRLRSESRPKPDGERQ